MEVIEITVDTDLDSIFLTRDTDSNSVPDSDSDGVKK